MSRNTSVPLQRGDADVDDARSASTARPQHVSCVFHAVEAIRRRCKHVPPHVDVDMRPVMVR